MAARIGLLLNRVALGAWVGAVLFLFLAGLAVLDAMPSGKSFVAQGASELRVSAGDIVGRVFRRYYVVAGCLGAIALVGALLSRWSGHWGRWQFRAHLAFLIASILLLAVDAGWLYGKVHALAGQIPNEGLQEGTPLHGEFWKWHGISMSVSAAVLVCGIVAAATACWPRRTASADRSTQAGNFLLAHAVRAAQQRPN